MPRFPRGSDPARNPGLISSFLGNGEARRRGAPRGAGTLGAGVGSPRLRGTGSGFTLQAAVANYGMTWGGGCYDWKRLKSAEKRSPSVPPNSRRARCSRLSPGGRRRSGHRPGFPSRAVFRIFFSDRGTIYIPLREPQPHDFPMKTRPGRGQGEFPKGASPSPKMLLGTRSRPKPRPRSHRAARRAGAATRPGPIRFSPARPGSVLPGSARPGLARPRRRPGLRPRSRRWPQTRVKFGAAGALLLPWGSRGAPVPTALPDPPAPTGARPVA